ncbi:unnamed protein product [Calypogeia fissa]
MEEVELFTTRGSPFGHRVQIALREKKIPFKITLVDFANKPQALLEANPIHQKVPTIIHNGKSVAESLVILEYLEDAFPGQVPLMPKDAFKRSKARFWIDYISKAQSTWNASFRTKEGTPERKAANDKVLKILKTLDDCLTTVSPDGPFFAGTKFSLVDVVLAPLCNALPVFRELNNIVVPFEELPRLHKWVEVTKVHPSVSSTLNPAEELLATWQRRQRSLA